MKRQQENKTPKKFSMKGLIKAKIVSINNKINF